MEAAEQQNNNNNNSVNEDISVTPVGKKLVDLEDPRSPNIAHRTPLGSPAPVRNWRTLIAPKDLDPRSPSLQNRTPTVKSTKGPLHAVTVEAFDPRSPSFSRSPFGLADSEEVAFPNRNPPPTSPYHAQHAPSPLIIGTPISASTSIPPLKDSTITFAQVEPLETIASPENGKKDGASLLDSNVLTNSQTSFQPMQSIELINPSSEASEEKAARKRKTEGKSDPSNSSPLKRSSSSEPSHTSTDDRKSKLSNVYTVENTSVVS